MKKDRRDRIPSSDLTAYERWELPLLDERGNEVWVRDEEMDLKPLTAEDLENIRQAAIEDGAREGREQGWKEGFEAGQEEGRVEGRREGQEEGRKAGNEEAQAATRAEVDAGLQRLESLMGEMLDPLERHTQKLESALLNVTLSLSRAVIHRELILDSSQIREVLKQAIAALPNPDEAIRIHVNPADSEWVTDVASRFEAGARIVADDDVLPGGCRVENRNSLVDLTVEKRFQKTVQKMLDFQLQNADAPEQSELNTLMGEMTDFHREVLQSPDELAPSRPSEPEPEPESGIPPADSGVSPNRESPGSGENSDENQSDARGGEDHEPLD